MNPSDQPLITIVDDEACIRESLSSLVRSVGYQAKEYASAEDFLTSGWWDEPACLILDIRLPAMNGLQLQRYLMETQHARPTVFISGHASENEETWARMKGAVAFLRKPFSDESLLSAVRTSIARGRAASDVRPETPQARPCPLCHESTLVAPTPKVAADEPDDPHGLTVKMIKTLHPGWVETDGLCERCWRFHIGLGRVVDFLRKPGAPAPAAKPLDDSMASVSRK